MSDGGKHVVRIRGLPWSVTQEEIAKHFEDCNLPEGKDSVHITFLKDGKPSGEAYLEFNCKEDADVAKKKDRSYMGKRYIEVFPSTPNEMDWVVKRSGPEQSSGDAIVRLRGLPFGCSKEEIAHFFAGLEIVPNGISLIIDPRDPKGRGTGEAYVQFASPDIAEQAMQKNKETIGHRYIEIFKSSFSEARSYLNQARMRAGAGGSRPGPYDRMDRFGGGGGGSGGGMGGGGGGMGGGYGGRGRNRGNMKGGFFDDDGDYGNGYGGGFGMGGGNMMGSGGGFGNMGGCGGGGGGGRFYGGGGGRMGGGGSGGGRMGGGGGGGGGGGRGSGRGGTPGDSFENSVTGHWVHMRGLPFQATEDDIARFFNPLNVVNCEIHFNNGRATGEADVDFASHDDAEEAMKKDREQMKHRYIELFLHSSPNSGMTHGMGNMGSGGMGNMGGGGMSNMGGYGGGIQDYSTGGDGFGRKNYGGGMNQDLDDTNAVVQYSSSGQNMGFGGRGNMGGGGGGGNLSGNGNMNRFGGGGGGGGFSGNNYTSFS